jgi:hypothetical protein
MIDMESCEWGKYSSRSIIDHTFRLKMILNKKINVIKDKILNTLKSITDMCIDLKSLFFWSKKKVAYEIMSSKQKPSRLSQDVTFRVKVRRLSIRKCLLIKETTLFVRNQIWLK